MLRANFFYKFFKYKENSSREIIKYNSYKKLDLQKEIKNKILEIDHKISENNKALLEAQIIKFRSTFSNSNNLIEKIGSNIYKTKVEESIIWHQNNIKELYLSRRALQINIEKSKGIFWLNQIKRFFLFGLIVIFIVFNLFIFLSGFMIIIYLLPLIILIFLGYLIAAKKK